MVNTEFKQKVKAKGQDGQIIEVPRIKVFYWNALDQMPLLLNGKDGEGNVIDVRRVPMTPAQLLYERVYGKNEEDRDRLRESYATTACGVFGHPNGSGEVVIGLYSDPIVRKLIHSLNSRTKSKVKTHSLPITEKKYQAIKKEGFTINPKSANRLIQDVYGEEELRKEIWTFLAEGDHDLADKHLRIISETLAGNLRNRMGFFPTDKPGMRLLNIREIGICSYLVDGTSDAVAANLCGGGCGHLYGIVAPEALNLEGKLDQVL